MRKLTSIEQRGVRDVIDIYDKYMNAHPSAAFIPTSMLLYKPNIAQDRINEGNCKNPAEVMQFYVDESLRYAVSNRFNKDFLSRVFLLDLLEDNGIMYFDKKMAPGVYEYCFSDQAKIPKYTPFVNMPANAALRILRHVHSNAIVNIELLKDLQNNKYKSNEELTLDEAKKQAKSARWSTRLSCVSVLLALIALIVSIISGNRPLSFEKSQYDSLLNNKFEICIDNLQVDSLLSKHSVVSIDREQLDTLLKNQYQLKDNKTIKE